MCPTKLIFFYIKQSLSALIRQVYNYIKSICKNFLLGSLSVKGTNPSNRKLKNSILPITQETSQRRHSTQSVSACKSIGAIIYTVEVTQAIIQHNWAHGYSQAHWVRVARRDLTSLPSFSPASNRILLEEIHQINLSRKLKLIDCAWKQSFYPMSFCGDISVNDLSISTFGFLPGCIILYNLNWFYGPHKDRDQGHSAYDILARTPDKPGETDPGNVFLSRRREYNQDAIRPKSTTRSLKDEHIKARHILSMSLLFQISLIIPHNFWQHRSRLMGHRLSTRFTVTCRSIDRNPTFRRTARSDM